MSQFLEKKWVVIWKKSGQHSLDEEGKSQKLSTKLIKSYIIPFLLDYSTHKQQRLPIIVSFKRVSFTWSNREYHVLYFSYDYSIRKLHRAPIVRVVSDFACTGLQIFNEIILELELEVSCVVNFDKIIEKCDFLNGVYEIRYFPIENFDESFLSSIF